MDYVLKQMEREGAVNVPGAVNAMRHQRARLVQTVVRFTVEHLMMGIVSTLHIHTHTHTHTHTYTHTHTHTHTHTTPHTPHYTARSSTSSYMTSFLSHCCMATLRYVSMTCTRGWGICSRWRRRVAGLDWRR